MSKDWPYATIVQEAANAGGPDAWLNTIKKAAYDNGASAMKNKLFLPLLTTGIGIGTVGTIALQKGVKWLNEKKDARLLVEQKVSEAEILLKQELTNELSELENENGGPLK